MKTIITFTFLLFTFLGFSQTTREEVVARTEDGHKLIVYTYSGTGNSEKLLKKTTYDYDISEESLNPKPVRIDYYGNYKRLFVQIGVTQIFYGIIKTEKYDSQGVLVSTKIKTDKSDNNTQYTLIP